MDRVIMVICGWSAVIYLLLCVGFYGVQKRLDNIIELLKEEDA